MLSHVLVVGALFLAVTAHAEYGFPDAVKFPAELQLDAEQQLQHEDVAEAEFAIDTKRTLATKRGAHWFRWFKYVPAKGDPAPGYDNGSEGRIFKAVTGALTKAGWQLVFVEDSKSFFSMKQASGGKERWLTVKMDAPQAQVNVELVEVGDASTTVVLKPPAAKPEVLTDADDFPFLPPWPGSTRKYAGHADEPMLISIPGKAESEAMSVGTGVASRSYQGPATLSSLQFVRDSRAALVKAGWKILYPEEKSLTEAAKVIAHYDQNGRDVWVNLFWEHGANLSYQVADVGAEDWAAKLEKDCRLPLYGVFFDFNKATLKPESESVLKKAAGLLSTKKGFAVEVQGHTDNVGGDAYNLTLSGQRAETVKAWLGKHGVEAGRLSSKGYGKTQPIADNGTDEGRAKNRRVELSGCAKK